MNRLAKLIAEMDLEDLKLLQKDMEAGNLDKLIRQRIEDIKPKKQCPTCGTELSTAEQKFSLEFGPPDLRQKAYFDEYDCMEYFLQKLKVKQ